MATVTVYSKPSCGQCAATKRALDSAGVAYDEVDVTLDAAAYEHVTETLNYSSAPVVEAGADHWSGFRPDKIEQLADRIVE